MNSNQKTFGLPENEVVFTTTDGVGLRKFDQYWYIDDRAKIRRITIVSGQDFPKGIRQYSTESLAAQFAVHLKNAITSSLTRNDKTRV